MQALLCHPQSRPAAVRAVMAEARRARQGLRARFVIEGELRVPEPAAPRMADRLWEHTCCEIFVAPGGGPAYHEFNLSPSGEWAARAFERYRKGRMLSDPGLDPRIAVRREPGTLELEALIRMQGDRFLVGLAAVVEAADGSLSYWALAHPPGRPDFHHRGAFALEL